MLARAHSRNSAARRPHSATPAPWTTPSLQRRVSFRCRGRREVLVSVLRTQRHRGPQGRRRPVRRRALSAAPVLCPPGPALPGMAVILASRATRSGLARLLGARSRLDLGAVDESSGIRGGDHERACAEAGQRAIRDASKQCLSSWSARHAVAPGFELGRSTTKGGALPPRARPARHPLLRTRNHHEVTGRRKVLAVLKNRAPRATATPSGTRNGDGPR